MNKSFKIETALSRTVLLIFGLICLIATVFFVRWGLANSIAVHAQAKEVAQLSVDLAPDDPQTHYALAILNDSTFLHEDLQKSVAEFEQATVLAPYDFRLWLALGKARERNGDPAGAEIALRRSLALAPSYASVQWTLGNVLLRHGKIQEAFTIIRRAAAGSASYNNQVINTAWQIFDGDLPTVRQHLGDDLKLNSMLAVFLAKNRRLDEALQIWTSLSSVEKKTILKSDGEILFEQLLAEKRYRDALSIRESINDQIDVESLAVGKVYNGGFEIEVKRERANIFDWQIADGTQPQIGFDDVQKHSGNRSLVVIFNSANGKDFWQITRTVTVEASRKYNFELFYKSDLKTTAALTWEILDASDGKLLAVTNKTSNAANWTNLKVEFTTSENTQAVTIRLGREQCKSIVCPISGKVWFDDLAIN